MTVPQLGFGTWTLKGDVAKESVKCAIQAGYRLIDSAQGYGNEADVWAGVVASGIPRNEVFITTKIAPDVMREGTVRASIDASLAAFGGTYIDLLLIHWPVKGKLEDTWRMSETERSGRLARATATRTTSTRFWRWRPSAPSSTRMKSIPT